MRLFIVLTIFALLALLQVLPMFRKHLWRDLMVYMAFYTLAFASALFYALDWPVLSPVKMLIILMNAIYRLLGYDVPE